MKAVHRHIGVRSPEKASTSAEGDRRSDIAKRTQNQILSGQLQFREGVYTPRKSRRPLVRRDKRDSVMLSDCLETGRTELGSTR